jgi:HK97 family phage prohead protease
MSHFSGYASITEARYPMTFYDEIVSRGAFFKTLSESPDVHLNMQHGEGASGLPIARTGQNMTLLEDDRGLRVDADLDDGDDDVRLLERKVRNGLIDGMSFAFRIVRQSWLEDHTLRRIVEASLHKGDVSVVVQGSNPAAGVISMRSAGALASLRAPGRDPAARRSQLAEQLGKSAVLEFRSMTLDGVQYDLGAEPSYAPAGEARGRVAVAPVVLPDHTTGARLQLARYRAGRTSQLEPADAVSEARRRLAAARARHR